MEIHHVEGTEEQIQVQTADGTVEQVQVQADDQQVGATRKLKGALDKYNVIPQLLPKKKKNGIFIPLEVLAYLMTACCVLRSRLAYF